MLAFFIYSRKILYKVLYKYENLLFQHKNNTKVVLLKIASVLVSFLQIMQIRVQNKSKIVWNSRYVGDVSVSPRHPNQRSRLTSLASRPCLGAASMNQWEQQSKRPYNAHQASTKHWGARSLSVGPDRHCMVVVSTPGHSVRPANRTCVPGI